MVNFRQAGHSAAVFAETKRSIVPAATPPQGQAGGPLPGSERDGEVL